MKVAFPVAIGILVFALPLFAAEETLPEGEPKPLHVAIAKLTPEHDAQTVEMTFTVKTVYEISGAVPVGQAPSFGIHPELEDDSVRFGVLVMGELSDAMSRFGFLHSSQPYVGTKIRAVGTIKVSPATAEREISYQLRISELKQFQIVSFLKTERSVQVDGSRYDPFEQTTSKIDKEELDRLVEQGLLRLEIEVEKLDKSQKVLGGNVRSLPKNEREKVE